MPRHRPFRAEHVGSMLRPARLKDAFTGFAKGRVAQGEYEAVLEDEVARVVRIQEDVGLQSITDGEFGRSSWFGFFFERMSGFRLEPSAFRFKDEDGNTYEWPTCYAHERIKRHSPITVDEFRRLRRLTTRTPKMTMPSPSAFHFFRLTSPADPAVYPDIDTYWADLIDVYRAEMRDLVEAGCDYVQLDEVPLAMLCDPTIREQVKAMGHDPDALTSRYLDALTRVLGDFTDQLTTGLHLCRGNFRSRWMASGGYEPIAERLFNDVPIDAYFLEYDSQRAGDFSPLRFVPKGKHVVLGLISSKTAMLEPPAEMRKRIDDATRHVPLDQLAISPQCGFASVAGGNTITEDDEIAKLRLVTSVAAEVWREA